MCGPLRRTLPDPDVLALESAALHDVCPVDRARQLARHRRVPGQSTRQAVPRRLSRPGRPLHAGDANERRDSRIFEDFALHLISIARPLYARDSWAVELAQTVYAIDASTVDLCLSLFDWAPATKGRAGIKLHTLLDLRGNIPAFIRVTGSRVSDVSFLDHLSLEAGSFYVMDRGYVHFARLMRFTRCAAFFVVRSKYRLHYRVLHVGPSSEALGVLKDEQIVLTGKRTGTDYPVMLRRIEFFDAAQNRHITLLTNHFSLQASVMAQLYKSRWQVELFFKWIKQNLRIKAFVGTSPNAVKTQIWSAICTYVLVAIVKKRLCIDASMHAILQVLSLSLFEVTPLLELLGQINDDEQMQRQFDQISLFEEISGQ
jgi:IS4 transposase